jgi:hypothetical protein
MRQEIILVKLYDGGVRGLELPRQGLGSAAQLNLQVEKLGCQVNLGYFKNEKIWRAPFYKITIIFMFVYTLEAIKTIGYVDMDINIYIIMIKST